MADENSEDVHDRLTPFLATLARVTSALGSLLASGTAQLIAGCFALLSGIAVLLARGRRPG